MSVVIVVWAETGCTARANPVAELRDDDFAAGHRHPSGKAAQIGFEGVHVDPPQGALASSAGTLDSAVGPHKLGTIIPA